MDGSGSRSYTHLHGRDGLLGGPQQSAGVNRDDTVTRIKPAP